MERNDELADARALLSELSKMSTGILEIWPFGVPDESCKCRCCTVGCRLLALLEKAKQITEKETNG